MTPAPETDASGRFLLVDGIRVPRFLYGTAWKEDDTQRLTGLALAMGFRGIDTANQRKHYHEAAVGAAIGEAMARNMVKRQGLFVQTKFTQRRGQDHRLPYDEKSPIAEQVRQSFARSLDHLGTDIIDGYVLHGPTVRDGLAADDWTAWRAMEEIHSSGQARLLGVSNVTLGQLRALCDGARVAPRFVQNRCYASRRWDQAVRAFCARNGIVYQGFSLLTANRQIARHPELLAVAKRHGRDMSQIIFRFALDAGMIALTGTSSAAHMKADLEVLKFRLDAAEVETIENLEAA